MTPRLPPELIREVSRSFSRSGDAKTLQSAALVSSSFRRPFQEIIFSTIKIRKQHLNQDNSAHHRTGLDIFRRNSVLITFVKAVSITNSAGGRAFTLDSSAVEPCMVELMQLLSTQFVNHFTYVGWNGPIGEGFEDAIIRFVRSPRLKSLELASALVGLWRLVESPFLGAVYFFPGMEQSPHLSEFAQRVSQLGDGVYRSALIKPPRVLRTDVLHGRITSPPLFTFPPEPPPDVSLEDTSRPLRLVFLPCCFYSPAFVRVPPLIVPLPAATPGFPIPPPPCPAVWCKFE
ncbi:hypothetical protein BKA70DRAFT_1565582 [Coprinopsis sp. MPI-PUGE-AT-0042]|nr:hypothetical protein BKA70DRAFT_1565582 [Coprinopsis sp. MPI-PUGE-AT-0042]